MSSGLSRGEVRGWGNFFSRFHAFNWSGRRLVTGAAALHLLLSMTLFAAGRAQIVPSVIDRDGIMDSFAHDSYEYQSGAIELAELLRSGQFANWATAAKPVHVKLIAIPFSLLSPIFGYSMLSAEPYNVLFYSLIVALVFVLGREVFNRRTGFLAGICVALWPTFLLHTTQLLKDSLFIAGLLILLFCVTTSLTRTYGAKSAMGVTLLTMLMVILLFFVRGNVVIVILGVIILILPLLIVRQFLQRQVLHWNIVPLGVCLLTALLLVSLSSHQPKQTQKKFPTYESGRSKAAFDFTAAVESQVKMRSMTSRPWNTETVTGRWGVWSDRLAQRVSSMRSRFAASYPDSGSQLDGTREFRSLPDLIAYLPRALEVGLWSPFPNTWFTSGQRIKNAGRLLAAAETCVIYLFQVMGLLIVVRQPHRLSLWFLLAITVLGVTALALIVPNAGALYRFRYTFWILLVITAMAYLDTLVTSGFWRLRDRRG
jgi:4-amino-4-deoxy-L-arabinose transferase-like glycosyltransferase